MKKTIKYIGLLAIPFVLFAVSCDSDDSYPDTSADGTVIYEISIVNGGLSGTETIVGVVNEKKKEITFPEVHVESDLTSVKFEAKVSDRAALDSASYNFVVDEGMSQKKRTISVVNGLREREYFVTIALDVPVWGADFTEAKRKVYDFSGNTTMYEDLVAANTRSADMDKDHVLIVSRHNGLRPHLLKIEDLKKGVTNPIYLNTTGVSGGTFAISGGRLANGQVYICNLNTAAGAGGAGVTKIYHWDSKNPSAAPKVMVEMASAQFPAGQASRYGDFMSVNLDENGNGTIYLGNNPSPANLLKLSIKNHTEVVSSSLVTPAKFGGLWMSFNEIVESKGQYIYTGHQGPICLVDESGALLKELSTDVIPNAGGSDARVITFNKERYLVMMAVPGTGNVKVYDITRGNTVAEAFEYFEAGDKNPLIDFPMGGAVANGTAAGSLGWYADGDETLYLMGAAPGAGFVVLEFPKKVKEKKE